MMQITTRHSLQCGLSMNWSDSCIARPVAEIDDISEGSNLMTYTCCSLILDNLLMTSDTWHLNIPKLVSIEVQGLQAKNDPA